MEQNENNGKWVVSEAYRTNDSYIVRIDYKPLLQIGIEKRLIKDANTIYGHMTYHYFDSNADAVEYFNKITQNQKMEG